MPSQEPKDISTHYLGRLTPEAYDQLEKQLPKLGPTNSPIEAGVLIGVQMVLAKLRAGFVITRQVP